MATEIKKIISRRDTAAKWEANNPILAQGEIGVDTTNKVMKIGDGVTPWKSLTGVGGVEIVNDLTTGGADKALSAEMGKQLSEQLTGDISPKDFEITEKDTDKYSYGQIVAPAGVRGLITFDVSEFEEFSFEVSVLTGSPIKCAIHRSLSLSEWGIFSADSGWITAGQTVIKDNTFGSATDGYLRLIITNNNGVGVPDISTILQYVTFTFSAQHEYVSGGVLIRLGEVENKVSEITNDLTRCIKKPDILELDITDGKAINSDGVGTNASYELINYLDISEYNEVKVTTGLWISGGGENYDTTVELYDSNKSLLKRYKARYLYGNAPSAFAFVYSDILPTGGASYIRFSNITSTPSGNTNSDFAPTEASVVVAGDTIDSRVVYDEELGKYQNEINKELNKINKELTSEIFGNSDDEIVDVITQSDLFDDKYLSTTSGGGRGYYNIPIESYDKYSCVIAIASDSTVKAAIALSKMTSYGDTIYDSKWIAAGATHSISEKTSTNTEVKYIQLRFTYSSGTGVPTLEEINQNVTILFEGITLADRGLKGKIEELEKVVFPSSASGYSYQGEKVSFKDNGFTSEVIGNLSAGVSSRQGGAVFGDYLFQFHNTLETIVVYNLKTKTNVQTLTLTPISNHHAGSGGFGNEYYDEADMFPILYISSMYENRVYGYRIIGNTAGSWTIETVQTITIDKQGLYIPNIAIDRENNMVVVFGYTKNSWSDSNNNLSVITSFVLPKLSDGDVTVTEFSDERKIPFIYAEQGSFARLGKLYMSYGNTISKCGMYVIDYVSGIAVSHAPFEPLGTFEPEAFALYGENIIMTGQDGKIYKLSF